MSTDIRSRRWELLKKFSARGEVLQSASDGLIATTVRDLIIITTRRKVPCVLINDGDIGINGAVVTRVRVWRIPDHSMVFGIDWLVPGGWVVPPPFCAEITASSQSVVSLVSLLWKDMVAPLWSTPGTIGGISVMV